MRHLSKFLLISAMFCMPVTATSAGEAEGLAAWEGVYKVFSHPRCANCHTPDDRPRWSGENYGTPRFHGMNVRRGDDGFGEEGQRCATCHNKTNAELPHGPPGADAWHLAPVEMVWWQKTSAEVCAQIKDPARNGDRTLQEVADHILKDPLVAWGWAPGKGREPAPGSAQETFDLLTQWASEGAPCPTG